MYAHVDHILIHYLYFFPLAYIFLNMCNIYYLRFTGRRSSSAKVFSALTWGWSSKSLLSNREIGDIAGSGQPCKPGAHCVTLERIYSEEQKLYKDVKVNFPYETIN